ncbi:DNA-binding MarR family transcriptional regulator [Pontibacter ummariensis]|uniref:DNA-binding transcriptional regulator, MarR family n=1 Tax=Pontibacter ummariensis TaxID=1610492 RepID=A0A239LXC4_9BACT|nr:MarR family transcriptional regulator [Pontibacter ummariensis]PRY00210.1 DNA-binding MarR family transcriptional regulator [Pontibacter ummariensis]SNT35101.1 DNA-binding transcriptional regulator, MarR family [Pontibacter ummariensis]
MNLENQLGVESFRNEWQKASMSILYTYGFLSNSYNRFFQKYDLTGQQYNALRILRDQYPRPVSTSFLREKMLDRMSDASRLVSRLQGKGLVEVTTNTVDKRLVNILISDKGQKALGAIDKDLDHVDAMVESLTEEEARELAELLHKVRESLRERVGGAVAVEQTDA